MTKNIIKGIDEVIKGLTTIKGAILAGEEGHDLVDEVKEAVKEVIGEVVHEEPEAEKEVVKEEPKKAKKAKEEPKEKTVEGFDREAKKAELEEIPYNKLKALAGTIEGIDAKGKKAELVEKILDAIADNGGEIPYEEEAEEEESQEQEEAVAEEAEEVEAEYSDEEVEEFTEFLDSLETSEVKEIAKEAGIEMGKRVVKAKLIEKLVFDLDVLINTLDAMGYYDEEEPAEVEEEVEEDEEEGKIAEEYGLNDYTVEELADICTEFELSTKGKKQALIDRIVKGIMDGTIELEDEDEEEEEKKTLKTVREHVNPEKELEIEEEIRGRYEKGKLKDSTIKKFVTNYYDGDPDTEPKKMSKEDMLEAYIEIHMALVDDDGDVSEMEEPYIRGEQYFCCGKELHELENGNLFCSVCGQEYTE